MINVKGNLISLENLIFIYYQDYSHTRNRYVVLQYLGGRTIQIEVKNHKEYENIRDMILEITERGKE